MIFPTRYTLHRQVKEKKIACVLPRAHVSLEYFNKSISFPSYFIFFVYQNPLDDKSILGLVCDERQAVYIDSREGRKRQVRKEEQSVTGNEDRR